ncbi:HAMP domain-containing sensor histidine kinase [Ponticaulis sp.]|uniref:sensor histidine kinase n=1 Tax=Ponticaulis sp. TaxID=2020902 RepID=UPI00262E6F76|nr:HAMP domain-containing sensor histidine kinase [Ponticaulis sp.]MDF1680340.1 HAMP domain-containing sensor histidine kinase [Ponticaulis sp.]
MSSNESQDLPVDGSLDTMSASDVGFARMKRETLDASLLGIITAKPVFSDDGEVIDFEYLTANRVLQRTHGISPEDLVGNRMLGVFPELADHHTFPYYCDVARTGEPIIFESDFQSDELDIHVVVSISKPSPDYITITFVEVSEIVRVSDALAELNALSGTEIDLEAYIQGALDIGRRAFNASRAYQLSFHEQGYSAKAQVGAAVTPEVKRPLPTDVALELCPPGTVKTVRNLNTHVDADADAAAKLPFLSFIAASFMSDEQTVGALVFCSKVARRREPTPSELKLVRTLAESVGARARLDAVDKALKQRNLDLERFASLVSHDLKAPLRTIRLLSEMLTEYVVKGPEADVIMSELRNNADQAQNMIKSLRDFAQLGAAGLQIEAVDVGSAVEDCLHRLAADMQDASAQVEILVDAKVLADRTLLIQVFSNLILNAIKYAGRDDPVIRIESYEKSDKDLVICVTDNGNGIDSRYAERIFELFRRVPGSEKKSEGEGVGLAVCRKIVESLGGKIWLDTDNTTGACFCVALPRAE